MSQTDSDTSVERTSLPGAHAGIGATSSPFSSQECSNDSSHSNLPDVIIKIESDNPPTPFLSHTSATSFDDLQSSDALHPPSPTKTPSSELNSAPSLHLTASDIGLDPSNLHVFVLSDAGKPIFTRYGDESKLAHIMGVIHALVSVVTQEKDQLQTLVTNDKKIVFKACGHLILVAVASVREPTSHLFVILKYVYNQVFFSPFQCTILCTVMCFLNNVEYR